MNPLLKNKVDLSTMSEQERQLFQKYGKLPKKNVLTSMQKERKYFDSGDYAMHKAGVGAELPVGSAIATPERLPHAQPPSLSSSPTNSSSMSQYAHHHSSSSASSPPRASALSPSNSFSVAQSPGIAIPGASSTAAAAAADPGLARSPSKSGGLSPSGSFGAGAGSGLTARRPSAGVGVASIPIPGSIAPGGFDSTRVSPPVAFSPLSSSAVPPSSFPIQTSHATGPNQSAAHVGSIGAQAAGMQPDMSGKGIQHHSSSIGHGSSPVKPSNLKRGFDRETAAVDEQAVED
ncbi:hypothetical protein NliqN6_4569 [Naganishia liquefaciens]|uniref:mRNA stability protein n=1 Tax=Naganishia liquefaciens TaxID=104408 RepID=A0A8H3YHG4_9TREE|nr:hypothetical protein NliqN6_4569 [Naganishia liquefaciens]